MFTIGLTGGVASGKSAAAQHFATLGVTIVDTDIIARQIVEPNMPAWLAIKEKFGDEILLVDQTIDRARLRQHIFTSKQDKQWLEALLHPLIREQMIDELQQADSAYAIAVIPLLVETLPNPVLDRILVIDAPNDIQLERLLARDNLTVAQGLAMLANQASREQRLAKADDVIENTGDLEHLCHEVEALHKSYLALAKAANKG